jgi:uncharacterized protein (TIGR02217 family)
MSYLPARFPLKIGRDPVGGPSFMTEIAATVGGFEQRNERWPESMHEFDFSSSIKSTEQFREVGAHFRQAHGRLHHFRVRDPADYVCETRDGFLDEITTTTFQACKIYGEEVGFQEVRRITRIFPDSLRIWKDGGLLALTTHYDVDEETGIVTFVTPPGESDIECEFMFDVPCRYDTDQLQATLVQFNGSTNSFHSWTSVPLKEVRE